MRMNRVDGRSRDLLILSTTPQSFVKDSIPPIGLLTLWLLEFETQKSPKDVDLGKWLRHHSVCLVSMRT